MVYVGQCETAFAIWQSLEAIHEATGHQTIITVIRNLFHTVADESVNISDHLNILKTNWEHINQVGDDDFKISDLLFKIIISSSLPMVWDAFTEPYVRGRKGVTDRDPKKMMTSQQFIGILKDEYQHRISHAQQADGPVVNQAMLASRRSLVDRIAGPIQNRNAGQTTPCRQCGRTNHETQNCLYLGALSVIKCDECGKFGHLAKRCWGKKGQKRNRPNKDTGRSANKKAKTDHANAATEQSHAMIEEVNDENASVNEAIVFVVEEGGIQFDESEIGQYSGFKEYAANSGANDECVLYYDWLSDSATTSHICNAREAFVSYQPANGTTVAGVGDAKTSVMGRDDVVLLSQCEGRTYELQLKNVLHIPSN